MDCILHGVAWGGKELDTTERLSIHFTSLSSRREDMKVTHPFPKKGQAHTRLMRHLKHQSGRQKELGARFELFLGKYNAQHLRSKVK